LTDEWVALAPLPQPRFRHAAAVVGQNLFLFGGRDINDNVITSIDVFDSLKNAWQTLNSVWGNATSDLVAAAIGSNIYAIGGYSQVYDIEKTVWVFDTINIQWSLHQSALNAGRGDACAVTIDNSIYVLGGFADNFCSPLDSLEVFSLTANSWQIKSKLHNPRADLACGVQHGEFHAIGGERKSSLTSCSIYDIPIRDVEHYHTATDTWTEETPLNNDRFRFASASYGTTFYIFGGQGPLVNSSSITYPVLNVVQAWNDGVVEPETADEPEIVIDLAFLALLVLQAF